MSAGRARSRTFGSGIKRCNCGDSDKDSDLVGDVNEWLTVCSKWVSNGTILVTATLTLTAPAVVVIGATVISEGHLIDRFQIQRDSVDVTDETETVTFGYSSSCGDIPPYHHFLEACEELPAGTYSWSLTVVTGAFAWSAIIKAREVM